ncbi:MAG: acylase [Acidobacteria bacterium]|nr:acylase [Acidobacteriota bacterium]
MKRLIVLFILTVACASCSIEAAQDPQRAAWQRQAQDVTITRDDWGIAHVHGKTDADAVFGLIYAQAEDDFNRVETNYLNSMGRLAEAEGEAEIYRDLRMKLFVDPIDLKAKYESSPDWLKRLMNAWADGLNYYLATHPSVSPRVITRFEPWMALSYTEGSIGGDVEKVGLGPLEAFYGTKPPAASERPEAREPAEPAGSNGFAVAPSNTASHRAMLWINPHTSFFFRSEVQVTSDEGLNAYGAVTWGQFFVYQGFNERVGWMHTTSGVDNIDEYLETVVKTADGYSYRYGREERPVRASTIDVPYKTPNGMASKSFTVYRTHHGPVVRELNGKWVAMRLMQEPVKALTQSYSRTKARDLKAFRQILELHTNSSNNTVYADADGNIAYFHSNFIPRRDPTFDWTKPVDGSNPATEWGAPLSIDETPGALNPPNGWIQNTNNWPFSVSGPESPKKADFPVYVESGGENPRGVHAMKVLSGKKDFTMDSLVGAAFDPLLPEFQLLMPSLVKAWDDLPASDPLKAKLADQIGLLRAWDCRWSVSSVPTALAVAWGEDLWQRVAGDARGAGVSVYEFIETKASAQQRLESLAAGSDKLQADFGTWKTPWGEINRFQRLTGDIVQPFNDAGASLPVGFTSSRWGSLAAFGARAYRGTKKMYGTSGNSFLAVVEFGDRVRARAVSAGGESGDPASKHFNDQAQRYTTGNLRDVYFYPAQLEGHIERRYHPGA